MIPHQDLFCNRVPPKNLNSVVFGVGTLVVVGKIRNESFRSGQSCCCLSSYYPDSSNWEQLTLSLVLKPCTGLFNPRPLIVGYHVHSPSSSMNSTIQQLMPNMALEGYKRLWSEISPRTQNQKGLLSAISELELT